MSVKQRLISLPFQNRGALIRSRRQPDLPLRLKHNLELAPSDRKTHYTHGPEGYIDYPFATEVGIGDPKHRF